MTAGYTKDRLRTFNAFQCGWCVADVYDVGVDDVDDVDDVDGVDEDYCTPDNLSMEDRLTNTIEITKRMSDAVE